MSFCSIEFFLFLPIVSILYYVIPNNTKINYRSIWLLITSYFFYMSWNPKYAVLILFSTVVTYYCGIAIEKINNSNNNVEKVRVIQKKACLIICIILNLSILLIFKYGNFFLSNISFALNKIGLSFSPLTIDLLLPVGISFYTFQALGYTIDVYRKEIHAEENFIQYALFVSFFPQLVAGPIERSGNLIKQLRESHKFDGNKVRDGLIIMLYGYFMKLVIADRIAVFVDSVYANYEEYRGWYIIVATILFGIQIYCDFNGYTLIARGAAKIMGFELMENFDAPYLASTVSEFWKRWHISLTSWFRDYLYIPLGGNRCGKLRKYINIIIVFGISGLWHGANWTFVLWGLLNGVYQIIGSVLRPIRDRIVAILGLNRSSLGHRIIKVFGTFLLVDFSWLFFRASTISDALNMVRSIIFCDNFWILVDRESIFKCGLDRYDFGILIISILILASFDLLKANRISITRDIIYKQDLWFRWSVYIAGFLFVLIFGVWGSKYVNTAFLYFQF